MEYTVEITIPEAREDVFMSIFAALVDGPPPVAAVGDINRIETGSKLVIALDAVDAHAASTAAVQQFTEAVARSGVAETADTAILGLHVERDVASLRVALREEVRRLAEDPQDRAEMRAVLDEMEQLAHPSDFRMD
jgi:hypothetical protein